MCADRESGELRTEESREEARAGRPITRSASAFARDEEAQNRPYRRFVRVLFFVALIAICTLVLRGIIRHLDRLPSVDQLAKPEMVDERALRACAEDLERLEVLVRTQAARVLTYLPQGGEPKADQWEATAKELEIERLRIVARCRLDEPSQDPVVADLWAAANALEELHRSYTLLYARHKKEGLGYAIEIRAAIQRATAALKTR